MYSPYAGRFLLSPTRSDDNHDFHDLLPDTLKQAAVLIGFVNRNGEDHIVLIQRAFHLNHHPGQVAFPGGRFEPEVDHDLIDTAIRETFEETGIVCERRQVLGNLSPIKTVSGYQVTPFVANFDPNFAVKIDEGEVHHLFEAPANWLLNPKNVKTFTYLRFGKQRRVFAIPYENYTIWGATAQMLKSLSEQVWHSHFCPRSL
uniref:CoA pyrophosphatase n=1 Tax=Thaumasiovibrio occultus TaxID=1891184 RepID=UPI000B35BAF4|nr:CoA pyrophosphatase [Thaumasiovibrio occultus]